MKAAHIVSKEKHGLLDVFGPTLQFLTSPDDASAEYSVMIGTIPPGVSIPLHSHADEESFYFLSGSAQALTQRGDAFEWIDVHAGELFHVPSGAKHAFQNKWNEPSVQLITTTPTLGRFFQEIGKPIVPGAPTAPPTPDELQRFLQIVAKYNYWTGSPQENAAVGIHLF